MGSKSGRCYRFDVIFTQRTQPALSGQSSRLNPTTTLPQPAQSLASQRLGMKGEVFADEGGDEMVAVIIVLLHTQLDADATQLAGGLQVLRKQLPGQKFITGALIDQMRRQIRTCFDKSRRIVVCPAAAILTQIRRETRLPPAAVIGIADGRKGRHRLIGARFLQCADAARRAHPWNDR